MEGNLYTFWIRIYKTKKRMCYRMCYKKQKNKAPENTVFSGLFWRAWEDTALLLNKQT